MRWIEKMHGTDLVEDTNGMTLISLLLFVVVDIQKPLSRADLQALWYGRSSRSSSHGV